MKSKDYIKGFKHGINWYRTMAIVSLNKYTGTIGQGELASLEIELNNILADSKEAVKNLKKGR
jgi:hypothetical protein